MTYIIATNPITNRRFSIPHLRFPQLGIAAAFDTLSGPWRCLRLHLLGAAQWPPAFCPPARHYHQHPFDGVRAKRNEV
jgi:hypothetical protein